MKRAVIITALLVATSGIAAEKQFLSNVYTIDRIYRSMEGPSSIQKVFLGDPAKPELLWITGIRTEMVEADGTTPQLPELMCHVNVDLDTTMHQAIFGFSRPTAARLMTLSQGMLSAKLPAGYGFPLSSNEPLLLFTQVLNLNIEHPKNLKVRHRVTIDYVRDADLRTSMKPLFNLGASGMVQLDDNPMALASMNASMEPHGASCLVGTRAPQAMAGAADYIDPAGRHMTGHWIVPPGRQVNASDITWFLNLPFDTRVHYAAVHLHPFAESLTVRDVTTGETLFLSRATNPATGIGLTHVDTYESGEGIPIYKDHKYELISVYNNPAQSNADSMASVFLGLDDPEFVHPSPAALVHRSTALFDSNELVIHTTAGEMTAFLARDLAPTTSVQVAMLVLGGVFDNATTSASGSEIHIHVPATDAVRRFLEPLGSDRGLQPDAETIAYCHPDTESSDVTLRILTADAHVSETRCVAFGRVTGSRPVIRAIHDAPAGVSLFVRHIDAVVGETPAPSEGLPRSTAALH